MHWGENFDESQSAVDFYLHVTDLVYLFGSLVTRSLVVFVGGQRLEHHDTEMVKIGLFMLESVAALEGLLSSE